MELKDLENKRILVLGFGREGKDDFLALRKLFPNKIIGIADQNKIKKPDKNTVVFSGKNYLNKVRDYEVILKTPGIPEKTVKPLLKKNVKLTTQTEIFFDNFKGMIVGVTGTKGKGTTASLIYHILKKAGLKVHLVGNIGKPVLQKLLTAKPDEIFVYELSSHQLQTLKRSPQVAVFLNLFPDHLDYYQNLQEYYNAKANILKYQNKNNFLVYNARDKQAAKIIKKSKAQKIAVRTIKTRYQSNLKGKFNALNIEIAVRTAKLFNVSEKAIRAGIKAFKGLPCRLEYVGKYQDIEFYNDSMSTLPEVTIAALNALKPKVQTLLVGGSEKGSNYQKLTKVILKHRVKNLIILGQGTGQAIAQNITKAKNKNKPAIFFVGSMKQAIEIAYQKTTKGKICLLSPGAASFNLFKDYKQRGDLFKKYIKYFALRNAYPS